MKRTVISGVLGLILVFTPLVASAQPQTNTTKGLSISPLRAFVQVNAGATKTASLTVANNTTSPLTVQLFDKQFSVADYTYDYRFATPQPDLVTIGVPQVVLQPGKSQVVPYTVAVPKAVTPGGYYYTLFASATPAGDEKVTLQAASLLYVTVNGELYKTTELQSASIQRVSFGKDFSYQLQARNTGNVHYFVYTAGQLHGPSARPAEQPATHILLPGKVRTITGSISAPVLPGIYKAEYGYKTDSGQEMLRSSLVAYIPPWSIAFLLIVILAVWSFVSHRRKQKLSTKPKEE